MDVTSDTTVGCPGPLSDRSGFEFCLCLLTVCGHACPISCLNLSSFMCKMGIINISTVLGYDGDQQRLNPHTQGRGLVQIQFIATTLSVTALFVLTSCLQYSGTWPLSLGYNLGRLWQAGGADVSLYAPIQDFSQ